MVKRILILLLLLLTANCLVAQTHTQAVLDVPQTWTASQTFSTINTFQAGSAFGGSTANLSILGFLNDSNTAPVLNIDTPMGTSGPQQGAVRFGTNGFSQFQICNFGGGAGAAGANIFGSTVACGSIYTTAFAKNIFMTGNAAHTLIRGWEASAASTSDMIQLNNATAAGTGFNFLTAYAGVSGTDTFHTGGTKVFSVDGAGDGFFAGTLGVTGHFTVEGVTSTGASGTGKLLFDTGSTPASMTLTNATGLPISTGVSGLGTGVATFLATPNSANLMSAVTDETGSSGSLVFSNSATLVNPTLGTPASVTLTNGTGLPGAGIVSASVTATQLAAQYSKGSCTEVWGGSGTSFAMAAGDDAISNNSCYNDSGVTRTITAVKCRSDNAANTTALTPTFGSAGTGTAILTGTVTCGNSYAYSSTGTVTNAAWTTGTGIDPGMTTIGNATSIALIMEYTY
jgi:hypothetical protein